MNGENKGFLSSFRTRSFRVGGYSVAAAAMVLAIAVLANVIVSALPLSMTQIDTSYNQLFSISDQTTKLVKGLIDDVEIYWIAQDGSEDNTIEKLLDNYEDLSKHIRVEKIDPDLYPTFVQQYTNQARNNSLVVVSGTRSRYVDYYDIYQYQYSYSEYSYDYTVSGVEFAGESELTSAIDYVVSDSIPKLYLLTGHGELGLPGTFATALNKENVETAELSLLTVESVPADADAVMVCAPQSDISESERDMLLSYLQAGGNLFLISGPLQDGTLTNLEGVMAQYGVDAQPGIVVESDSSRYMYSMPFYLLPSLSDHSILAPLNESGYRVLLPIAQGLTVQDNLREGLSVSQLLTTSDGAYSKTVGYNMTTYSKETGDVDGPFTLAVAVTEAVGAENTQIVWVSSAMVLDTQTNSQVSGGNLDFFLNSVNWMCEQDESSLSIRGKSLSNALLSVDGAAVTGLSLMMVGVIPLIYLSVGIFTWARRRRR